MLRSLACLSILLLHVLERVYNSQNNIINQIDLLLVFGTPTFVFISEFILSYSYKENVPKTFWKNRINYLLLPYLFFGTFYALSKAMDQSLLGDSFFSTFLNFLWRIILLGDFHGYFILIIFQFYAIHASIGRFLIKFSPKLVIAIALLINLIYLGFFNFVKPLNIPHADYIWNQYYWIPFPGWIFYFTIAFYSGYYFSSFREKLSKNRYFILICPFLFGFLSIILYIKGILPDISSKRVDILFFTISLIFLLYYLSTKLSNIPRFFVFISKYSFGIYLFHPFFLGVYASLLSRLPLSIPPLLLIPTLFFGSILFSIIIVYLFNKMPFGAFLVGKVGIGVKTNKISQNDRINKNTIKV